MIGHIAKWTGRQAPTLMHECGGLRGLPVILVNTYQSYWSVGRDEEPVMRSDEAERLTFGLLASVFRTFDF